MGALVVNKKNLGKYVLDDTGHMKGQTKKESAVGYCHNKKHHGFLSVKMMKQHKCLEKGCKFFEPYDQHPHWIKKSVIKVIKKQKKEMNGAIYINDKKMKLTSADALVSYAVQQLKETQKIPVIEYREM